MVEKWGRANKTKMSPKLGKNWWILAVFATTKKLFWLCWPISRFNRLVFILTLRFSFNLIVRCLILFVILFWSVRGVVDNISIQLFCRNCLYITKINVPFLSEIVKFSLFFLYSRRLTIFCQKLNKPSRFHQSGKNLPHLVTLSNCLLFLPIFLFQ